MNRGSSSLKATLYDAGDREELLLSISLDHAGASPGRLKIVDPHGNVLRDTSADPGDPGDGLGIIFEWLGSHGYLKELAGAGHRFVHGGARYRAPHLIQP